MPESAPLCAKCGKPFAPLDSVETARRCQWCGSEGKTTDASFGPAQASSVLVDEAALIPETSARTEEITFAPTLVTQAPTRPDDEEEGAGEEGEEEEAGRGPATVVTEAPVFDDDVDGQAEPAQAKAPADAEVGTKTDTATRAEATPNAGVPTKTEAPPKRARLGIAETQPIQRADVPVQDAIADAKIARAKTQALPAVQVTPSNKSGEKIDRATTQLLSVPPRDAAATAESELDLHASPTQPLPTVKLASSEDAAILLDSDSGPRVFPRFIAVTNPSPTAAGDVATRGAPRPRSAKLPIPSAPRLPIPPPLGSSSLGSDATVGRIDSKPIIPPPGEDPKRDAETATVDLPGTSPRSAPDAETEGVLLPESPFDDHTAKVDVPPAVVASADRTQAPGTEAPGAATASLPYNADQVRQRLGDYDLLSELGRGRMGVVYKAFSLRLQRYVAIRVITAGENASEAQAMRFHNEAALAARLDHPNVVTIFDSGEVGTLHYFVMEHVAGKTLTELCGAQDPKVRNRAVALVAKTARALAFAHSKQIIHRDVKPDNILVDLDGEPHIADFGIAKVLSEGESAGVTSLGQVIGTPIYMAPEQANGEVGGIGPRSDVYSLGATLYQVLCGKPPFHASRGVGVLVAVLGKEPEPLSRIASQSGLPPVDSNLATVCARAMAKEAAARYESADAFAEDLERALRDEPIAARPIGFIEKVRRKLRQSKPLLVGAFVIFSVLATLVAAFGVVTLYNSRLSEESLREKDLEDAKNQAKTLERAIAVNMLLGRADSARRLLGKLAADPDIGTIRVVRTDRTIAYTDAATRFDVERRLRAPGVLEAIEEKDPGLFGRIEDLKEKAFRNIDAAVAAREHEDADESFDFDAKVWKSVVSKAEGRTITVAEDGKRYLFVLRPIKNAKECHVCHGKPDEVRYGVSNKIRAVLVVKRSLDRVEEIIAENRQTTLTIGGVTIGAFLVLIFLLYRVFGVGVPKRRFAA